MATILDTLDDIYCLQESDPQERAHLLALLEDAHLHQFLEVSLCKNMFLTIIIVCNASIQFVSLTATNFCLLDSTLCFNVILS